MQNPKEDKTKPSEQASGSLDETAPLMASTPPQHAQEIPVDIAQGSSDINLEETIPLAPSLKAPTPSARRSLLLLLNLRRSQQKPTNLP